MKKSKFTEEQMVRILREADEGNPVDVAKKHGISKQALYVWRKKFRGMQVDDVKRLKSLEAENAKLKKLLTEKVLETEILKEVKRKKMVSARGRRKQVAYARSRGLSKTKACTLVSLARIMLGYPGRLEVKDAPVIDRMAALAQANPRWGYRRVRVLLAREGLATSPRRALRLLCRAGLHVPKKRRRRIPARTLRPVPPSGRNHVWCYDFVFDTCASGQPIKCLTVVDEYTRECLAIDVQPSIRSQRVIDVLARLITVHGAPAFVRSDNGPEFIAQAIQDWLKEEGIETAYITPGKPWQNGLNESFNGKFRDECFDMEWFPTRREAAVLIEQYRQHYNAVRPHSSLGYRTPHEFKGLLQANPQAPSHVSN